MTTLRPGDRVRCVTSTVDVLAGWELRGTRGTVVDVATVPLGIDGEGWEEVWVRWGHAAPTWPQRNSIRLPAEDVELVREE